MVETFLQICGLRVHYLESGDEGASKLLLIHGLGGTSKSWEEVFDRLSESFHVIAIDLPGFGKSDKPLLPYTLDNLADLLCSFMKSTHFYPVIIVGHSMGGMISIKAYKKCREKFQGIILVNAAGMSDAPAKKIREYMEDRWSIERLRKYYQECLLGRLGRLDETRLREFMQMFEDPIFPQLYTLLLDEISRPLLPSDFAEIKVPTLIIWGSDDRLIPLIDGVRISKAISGSTLMIIEGAGHSPHREAPEQFISAIRNFASKIKNSRI
ncbi:MAG: alpha/beta hydrolase [Nitrososphaerota archaeon]